MQNEEDHASYPSRFMKKNHSTHIKWAMKTKEEALKMAQKYGFESLSPYLRYLASEGFADMFMMVLEIHHKLMEGQISKVSPSTLELRDRLASSKLKRKYTEVTQDEIEGMSTEAFMEKEILIES